MTVPALDQRIIDTDFLVEPWVSGKLDTRIRNSLLRHGIMTISQLAECTRTYLNEHVQGIGIVCIVVIEMKLESMGLQLKDE